MAHLIKGLNSAFHSEGKSPDVARFHAVRQAVAMLKEPADFERQRKEYIKKTSYQRKIDEKDAELAATLALLGQQLDEKMALLLAALGFGSTTPSIFRAEAVWVSEASVSWLLGQRSVESSTGAITGGLYRLLTDNGRMTKEYVVRAKKSEPGRIQRTETPERKRLIGVVPEKVILRQFGGHTGMARALFSSTADSAVLRLTGVTGTGRGRRKTTLQQYRNRIILPVFRAMILPHLKPTMVQGDVLIALNVGDEGEEFSFTIEGTVCGMHNGIDIP